MQTCESLSIWESLHLSSKNEKKSQSEITGASVLHTNGPVHQRLLNNSCTHHLRLHSSIPSLVPYIQKSQFSKVVTEQQHDGPLGCTCNAAGKLVHRPMVRLTLEEKEKVLLKLGRTQTPDSLTVAAQQGPVLERPHKSDLMGISYWSERHPYLPLQWSWRYLLLLLLVCPLNPPSIFLKSDCWLLKGPLFFHRYILSLLAMRA